MNITNSPDITSLGVQVTFDISGLNPLISLVNASTGPHLNNMTWAFIALSPSGTYIHQGDLSAPDITGTWTNFTLSDSWPRPFNQIEWSGAPYQLIVTAKDSIGNVYTTMPYTATICRPVGNDPSSKNMYGIASVDVKVLCQQARTYFEDRTLATYKGNTGTQTASVLKVVYPIDPTGNVPTPFSIGNFSAALVPISYSSDNYQFLVYSIYSYDLGNGVSVLIRYQLLQTFSVLCNIDLMPLVCEVQKIIDSIQNGSCVDVEAANNKLMLINPKFALVIMGILQPLTGIDVMQLIEDIQTIGGFSCDCCSAPSGIIPTVASVIDGYTFSVVPVCGDVNGSFTQTGTNIQLNLQDKSYVFNIGATTGTTAFSVTPATAGCNKTYSLNVDATQLATDILNIISTNAGLVNLFNSLVNDSGTNLVVDGKCIFTSTASYNYTFTLINVPSNTTFALATGITVGGIVTPLTFSLNLTNLPAFQTYLNSLGLGTFAVSNPSGQTVLIASTANPNQLSNFTYSISGPTSIADQTTTASGYVPISANVVVQNIINYLCGLTDAQIKTSQPYTITYVDAQGHIQTAVIPAGTTLTSFLNSLMTYSGSTLENIDQLASVTCDSLKQIFQTNTAQITGTDLIYGTKGNGACSGVSYAEAFQFMLQAAQSNSTLKNLFCQVVTSCGAGLACSPYTYLNVQVSTFNAVCTPIMGIVVTLA